MRRATKEQVAASARPPTPKRIRLEPFDDPTVKGTASDPALHYAMVRYQDHDNPHASTLDLIPWRVLRPGDVTFVTYKEHDLSIVTLSIDGFYSGRLRHFIACLSCSRELGEPVIVHEATTGPRWMIDAHIREWNEWSKARRKDEARLGRYTAGLGR